MHRFTLSQMGRLPRLADIIMPNDRDFFPEKLITELGLYEAVLIDTADIQVFDAEIVGVEPHLEVSIDVEAFHRFINLNDRIMLPCADCKQNQPFDLKSFFNPQRVSNVGDKPHFTIGATARTPVEHSTIYAPVNDRTSEKMNVFDPPKVPKYQIGQSYLRGFDHLEFQNVDVEDFKRRCSVECLNGIAEKLCEVRRNFVCTLDDQHRGFVDFIIYKAVDGYMLSSILREYEERRMADPNAEMTKDEAQAAEAYERLKTCLIMEKVGQYPSMADLQMFDIEKYRSVLSKDHFRDFKTALGLYASGVGCGSFIYLRRIFEGLVVEAETLASQQKGWNAEEYERRRFNEKIEYLEAFGQKIIPDVLVGVKGKIYGILSRGVHQSSDQECNELFPVMKYVIEEVLDHRIAIKEREDKLKRLGTVLGKV